MFPSLFKGLDMSQFQCDTCEFAKHTRVSFPINNKRSSHPFDLFTVTFGVLPQFQISQGLAGLFL